MSAYFDPSFFQFYIQLAGNNNRDWFHANKNTYEQTVKKPFERFVEHLIAELAKEDKRYAELTPGSCIFRINRDVRFSKDKTPYKLHSSAVVSIGGKKSEKDPGLYVEFGPERVAVAGGVYQPGKEELADIRAAIALRPKEFMKLVKDAKFKQKWGDIQGEKNKILPAELKEVAADCPYVYHKQFYFWAELDPEIVLSPKLIKTLIGYYQAGLPLSEFLAKALH
jgi:uncharacterized protein (TIGR02453 family)